MGKDNSFNSADYRTLHHLVNRAIQESYDTSVGRFVGGNVAPQFIHGFYDRAADSVAYETAKFIERRRYDCASDSVAAEFANLSAVNNELAIHGLREQITDNVKALIPFFKANGKIAPGVPNDVVFAANQQVAIVTIGQEPAVRACVFSSGTAVPKKLIHSDQANDATSALSSLLKKTQSMLATQFGYNSKFSTASTKVGSDMTGFSSASTLAATPSQFTSGAAPSCGGPASKSKSSKSKTEEKPKHARTKSNKVFWGSSDLNNASFQECCDEPSIGGDSGFLSRDGEPHPNRSYNDLTLVAAQAELQHARIFAEATPPVAEVEEEDVESEEEKFF